MMYSATEASVVLRFPKESTPTLDELGKESAAMDSIAASRFMGSFEKSTSYFVSLASYVPINREQVDRIENAVRRIIQQQYSSASLIPIVPGRGILVEDTVNSQLQIQWPVCIAETCFLAVRTIQTLQAEIMSIIQKEGCEVSWAPEPRVTLGSGKIAGVPTPTTCLEHECGFTVWKDWKQKFRPISANDIDTVFNNVSEEFCRKLAVDLIAQEVLAPVNASPSPSSPLEKEPFDQEAFVEHLLASPQEEVARLLYTNRGEFTPEAESLRQENPSLLESFIAGDTIKRTSPQAATAIEDEQIDQSGILVRSPERKTIEFSSPFRKSIEAAINEARETYSEEQYRACTNSVENLFPAAGFKTREAATSALNTEYLALQEKIEETVWKTSALRRILGTALGELSTPPEAAPVTKKKKV